MQGREVELFVSQQQGDEMDAYERLISEALIGDTAHFARQDEVEAAWAIVDPLLNSATPPLAYPSGSWGPVGRPARRGSLRLARSRRRCAGLDALVRAGGGELKFSTLP